MVTFCFGCRRFQFKSEYQEMEKKYYNKYKNRQSNYKKKTKIKKKFLTRYIKRISKLILLNKQSKIKNKNIKYIIIKILYY